MNINSMKTIKNILRQALFLLLALLAVTSCDETPKYDEVVTLPPVIHSFSPESGKAGTEITITGENLQYASEVSIGGGKATLKYRINPTSLVVVVNADCRTGVIELKNELGSSQSPAAFTVVYAVPSLTLLPASGAVNAQTMMEGDNLDAVSKVLFGTSEAKVIHQSANELVTVVPFVAESEVKVYLEYFDGMDKKRVESVSSFAVVKEAPQVVACPERGESGSLVELTGEKLSAIDAVLFGTTPAVIIEKTDNRLSVMLPTTEVTTTAPLIISYYGIKETIVTSFELFVTAKAKVLYWENVSLFCQGATEVKAFFNATTGEAYTPCEIGNIEGNTSVHFYTVYSGAKIVIGNPNQGSGKMSNFKCDGVSLGKENFPNNVRFRTLTSTKEEEKKYIDLVTNKQLEEISYEQMLAEGALTGIPGSNGPVYNANKVPGEGESGAYSKEFVAGDVMVITQLDATGTTVLKTGFIEVLKVDDKEKASEMIINCYWQN